MFSQARQVAWSASLTCALVLWACRDRTEAAPTPASDRSSQANRAASVPVRTVPLPACLGASLPIELSGQLPYARITVGAGPNARVGSFLLDFGSTGSAIDDRAFVPSAPVPAWCTAEDAGVLRPACEYSAFDFFGPWGRVSLYRDDFSALHGSVVQAGILGTDFLSVHRFTLDFDGLRIFAASDVHFCSDATLVGAGFIPLSTVGFYAKHRGSLRPLSDVAENPDGGADGYTVPNVPTIPFRVAGVDAFAQLDTGFDDAIVAHAINVNEPLFDAIMRNNPAALVRDDTLDLTLSTCIPGVGEDVEGYRLAPGSSAVFISEAGGIARSESRAVLFVKRTPPRVRACGGIGTWRVPAAQLAASYFVNAGVVVFDPVRGRVWLPRN